MNDIVALKRKQINDYISSIELDENSISVFQMKNDLHKILGEKPGIELKYKNETIITEAGNKRKINKTLESITIFYTFENMDGTNFDRISYII